MKRVWLLNLLLLVISALAISHIEATAQQSGAQRARGVRRPARKPLPDTFQVVIEKGYQPETRIRGFDRTGNQVFDSGPLTGAINWPIRDPQGQPLPTGVYLAALEVFPEGRAAVNNYYRLRKIGNGFEIYSADQLLMMTEPSYALEDVRAGKNTKKAPGKFVRGKLERLSDTDNPREVPAEQVEEFFKLAVSIFPQDEIPQLCLGVTLLNRGKGLNAARAVFTRILERPQDCRTKKFAVQVLAEASNRENNLDESERWTRQHTDLPCVTSEEKAAVLFGLANSYWVCAFEITQRYADQSRLATEPLHPRRVTNDADRRRHEECVIKGLDFIGQALIFTPNDAQSLIYKSLLLREKQKLSTDRDEWRRYGEEADKLVSRSNELSAQADAQAPSEPQAPTGKAKVTRRAKKRK